MWRRARPKTHIGSFWAIGFGARIIAADPGALALGELATSRRTVPSDGPPGIELPAAYDAKGAPLSSAANVLRLALTFVRAVDRRLTTTEKISPHCAQHLVSQRPRALSSAMLPR
jgi:hypothetical protein